MSCATSSHRSCMSRCGQLAGIPLSLQVQVVLLCLPPPAAGRYEDAHRWYAKALELFDRNVDALVARGAASANEHRFMEAEADLQAAVELDPGNANAGKYLQEVREYCSKQQQEEKQQQEAQGHAAQQQGAGHASGAAKLEQALAQEQQQAAVAGSREQPQQQTEHDACTAERGRAPTDACTAERGRAPTASASTSGRSSRSRSSSGVCTVLAPALY
jgi:tetratricopeptide (TPR) repeat protein